MKETPGKIAKLLREPSYTASDLEHVVYHKVNEIVDTTNLLIVMVEEMQSRIELARSSSASGWSAWTF